MSQCSRPLTPTRLYHDPVERLECDPSAYNLAETVWQEVYDQGHHTGYNRAELDHADKIIRLKAEAEIHKGWLTLGLVCLAVAVLLTWSLIESGHLIVQWKEVLR